MKFLFNRAFQLHKINVITFHLQRKFFCEKINPIKLVETSISPFQGYGVIRENEADDIEILVQNFTAPALARSLREKETTLQNAARLLQSESYDELKTLLVPYLKQSIERKRQRRHAINISEETSGLTRKELVILQRYLHRMPRHVPIPSPTGKRASVIIPLCNVNGSASILFQKRSDKVRTHKQQVCFPGGMVDEDVDNTIIQTSLRELEEEIGICAQDVEVLGILRCDWSEIANMTGIAVTPVVGFIGDLEDLTLKPNSDEVEYLFTLTLQELLDESKWQLPDFSTPVYNGTQDDQVIWGLTGYILNHFLKEVILKCSNRAIIKKPASTTTTTTTNSISNSPNTLNNAPNSLDLSSIVTTTVGQNDLVATSKDTISSINISTTSDNANNGGGSIEDGHDIIVR